MSKKDIAEEKIKKAQELDPDDPLRRGFLEVLADWLLSPRKRNSHNWERVEDREKRMKW